MTKPTWLGPHIEELHGRKVFRSCQTNSGECICTGDYVYLVPADLRLEKYIGRIESMYEDESALKCVQVRWFYRPQDLQHEPPSPSVENEVYYTSYYDCQLIESVVTRCIVKHKQECRTANARQTSRPAPQDPMDVYICRYSYSAEIGQFVAIQEEEVVGSLPNLPCEDGKKSPSGMFAYEDIAVARQFANALLGVDRSVPREVARADWSTAKRLPWVLRAKNAMNLQDLKQLLIDLESGLEIFKHQREWRKSVQAISSFDTLSRYIQYLKHNVQRKVDDTFKKLRRMHSKQQSRRRKSFFKPRLEKYKKGCQLDKQESFQKFITMGSSFAIDHSNLPPKCLRVVMGTASCRNEKRPMEEQVDELWKSVEVMQDDVAVVLDSMGFSQGMLPVQSSEPGSKNLLALTDKADDDSLIESVTENTSKENILLFQMAAQVSSKGLAAEYNLNKLSSPASKQHSLMETASLSYFSPEKPVISPKEEQDGCGFRVWKPEGTFANPSPRNIACFQADTNKEMNISRPVLV
ncbi:hypothetical protein L7F22_067174 [Adiantum nelumboides]|nr:hypothetical protein [Adiantum nelumboides]